ncbi:MAG: peptidoglycan DD-metalloendopeptidase family protein [Pseudomonadota bacterium]
MEVAEHYLSLGSSIVNRPHIRRALSYISIGLFIALISFVSVSVHRFIGATISISLSEPEEAEATDYNTVEVIAAKGDTLSKILLKQNVSYKDSRNIIELLSKTSLPTINIGQKLIFDYDTSSVEDAEEDEASISQTLSQIAIKIDKIHSIEVVRGPKGWEVHDLTAPLKKVISHSSAVINNSFMSTAKSLGLSTSNILELIQAYSYQIDFQRQIKSGDKISFIMEKFFTEDGKFSHSGKVMFASMNLAGKNYNIYRYSKDNNDKFEYLSEDGRSVKRNLLRTPVSVARVSSHFGDRKHPILGFTKMHKGVDFAAPVGTPIYAAGDGVVTECGWKSGYGRFIQIKHSSTLSTAYAHASQFAKNIKRGSKVSQGQVIALVGNSGNTTGAHLHYEVKIDGRHVNPMSIKTTPGTELKGNERNRFDKFKREIHTLGTQLAKNA